MLMPVVYLGSAALDRRWSAWVVLLAGVAVLVVIPSSSEVVPSMIFLVAALAFLVVGVARGQIRKPGDLSLQTVGGDRKGTRLESHHANNSYCVFSLEKKKQYISERALNNH